MEKIELTTPDPKKVLPVLEDAIARQKRLLAQSLARSKERIQQLTLQLGVDPVRVLAGEVPHLDKQDMDLLELEGELELQRHLQAQLDSLEQLKLCP